METFSQKTAELGNWWGGGSMQPGMELLAEDGKKDRVFDIAQKANHSGCRGAQEEAGFSKSLILWQWTAVAMDVSENGRGEEKERVLECKRDCRRSLIGRRLRLRRSSESCTQGKLNRCHRGHTTGSGTVWS